MSNFRRDSDILNEVGNLYNSMVISEVILHIEIGHLVNYAIVS